MNVKKQFFKYIGPFITYVFTVFYPILTWSFVLMKTWNWSIIEVFNIFSLTYIQAVAIYLVKVIIFSTKSLKKRELKEEYTKDKLTEYWTGVITLPWVCLLFIWIIKIILF